MSTHAMIGKLNLDGSVDATYVHHDGYLSGVGQTLYDWIAGEQPTDRIKIVDFLVANKNGWHGIAGDDFPPQDRLSAGDGMNATYANVEAFSHALIASYGYLFSHEADRMRVFNEQHQDIGWVALEYMSTQSLETLLAPPTASPIPDAVEAWGQDAPPAMSLDRLLGLMIEAGNMPTSYNGTLGFVSDDPIHEVLCIVGVATSMDEIGALLDLIGDPHIDGWQTHQMVYWTNLAWSADDEQQWLAENDPVYEDAVDDETAALLAEYPDATDADLAVMLTNAHSWENLPAEPAADEETDADEDDHADDE